MKFLFQIKFNTEKKLSEQELQSWKTFVGLWFMLPILIYLRFFCAEFEIVTSVEGIGRESRLAMGLWQLLMILMELGLFIIFIGNKILMKVYRLFFLGIGLLSIFIGGTVIGRRALIQARERGPFSIGETPEFATWQDLLEENLFVVVGLTANVITLVVFNICDWAKRQDVGKNIEEQQFWDFGSYSEWVFKCIFISVLLNFATIFSNFLIEIGHFVIPDAFMATLIGMVMVIFGFYTFKNYKKKNFHLEDSVEEKPSTDVLHA